MTGTDTREAVETFTVDGVIRSAIAKPKDDPKDQCLCCRPLGHVYGYGVDIPSVTRPGITSERVPGSVNDWIQDLLYRDYRRDHGRKVRVTLEILPEPEAAETGPFTCRCLAEITRRPGENGWRDTGGDQHCNDGGEHSPEVTEADHG